MAPKLEKAYGLEAGQLIACSSVSGEGRQFLWKQIMYGLFEDDDDDELAADGDEGEGIGGYNDDDDEEGGGGAVLLKFM